MGPSEDQPPEVEIVRPPYVYWPYSNGPIGVYRIKARAFDPDGSIAEVRFYYDGKWIGTATAEPYTVLWGAAALEATNPRPQAFTAVAVDNTGLASSSAPVLFHFAGRRGTAVEAAVTQPTNGSVFAAPATIAFQAELLTSIDMGHSYPSTMSFYANSNLVGQVVQDSLTLEPCAITLTNLPPAVTN